VPFKITTEQYLTKYLYIQRFDYIIPIKYLNGKRTISVTKKGKACCEVSTATSSPFEKLTKGQYVTTKRVSPQADLACWDTLTSHFIPPNQLDLKAMVENRLYQG